MLRTTERLWVAAVVLGAALVTLVSVVLERQSAPDRSAPAFAVATSLSLQCRPYVGRIIDGRERMLGLFGWRRLAACLYPDRRLVICSDEDLEASLRFCTRELGGGRFAVLGVDQSHYYDDNRSVRGSLTLERDDEGAPQSASGSLELNAAHYAVTAESVAVTVRFEPARFVPPVPRLRRPWADYDRFLERIRACGRVHPTTLLAFARAGQARDPHGVTLLVRHDIDHDLLKALKMRQLEVARDIPATYFVLLSAAYFGARATPQFEPSTEHVPFLRALAATGAELGLHNDELAAAYYFGGEPEAELSHALAFLRGQGLTIRGTASHGFKKRGSAPADGWFLNYWMFRGRPPPGRLEVTVPGAVPRRLPLGTVDPAAHGLEYEAYALHYDYYLSDVAAAGNWALLGGGANRTFDELPVDELCGMPDGTVVQLLTHPDKWADRETLLPLTADGF